MFEVETVKDFTSNTDSYCEPIPPVSNIWDVMARCDDKMFYAIVKDFEQQYGVCLTEEQRISYTNN